MNQLFNAIIEGFGRAMGQSLFNFTKRSFGFGKSRDAAVEWETPEDIDGDDDDHEHEHEHDVDESSTSCRERV